MVRSVSIASCSIGVVELGDFASDECLGGGVDGGLLDKVEAELWLLRFETLLVFKRGGLGCATRRASRGDTSNAGANLGPALIRFFPW